MTPIPIEREVVHLTDQQRRRLVYLRRVGRHIEAALEEETYHRQASRIKTVSTAASRTVRELRDA